jgi:hypothetical protein
MAFAAWAAAQVNGLLCCLSDERYFGCLDNSAVQAQVALLYRSCLQHTDQEFRTTAAGRQFRIDLERTELIDALAEAVTVQLW